MTPRQAGALTGDPDALRAFKDIATLRQLADSVSTELELSALSREFEAQRLRFELAIDAAEIGSFDWDVLTGRLIWDDRLVELFPERLRRLGRLCEERPQNADRGLSLGRGRLVALVVQEGHDVGNVPDGVQEAGAVPPEMAIGTLTDAVPLLMATTTTVPSVPL